MINTVVFDFDGTIADTFNLSLKSINTIGLQFGIKLFDQHDIETLRSQSTRQIFKSLGIPLAKAPLILRQLKPLVFKQVSTQQPIPGIKALLPKLQATGFKLDIITSNTVATVSQFLDKHQLPFFDSIYSDRSLFGKHRVIAKYLKKHRLNPETVVYIGDEIRDIDAAHQAGIKIISVTWGFNSEIGLKAHRPDYLVNQPSQIIQALSDIQPKPLV